MGVKSEIHPPNFLNMHYVYILQSKKDSNLYVGLTSDLRNRFKLHNEGKVYSTKNRRPLILIYYESYLNRNDAAKREKFLKTGWGKNWIKRTLWHYFLFKKLGIYPPNFLFKKLGG